MSDRRPISAASMGTYGRTRNWGSAWKRFIREHSDRSHGAYIQKTTLPYEDNYLDLDPTVTDPLGLPVIRITGQFKDNERAIAAFMQEKMEDWYREAGAVEVNRGGLGNSMGASTHASARNSWRPGVIRTTIPMARVRSRHCSPAPRIRTHAR